MNITQYLKDLDAEEQQLRLDIMQRQVRVQQLQDMRVLMMQREEERAHASGLPSPFGTFPNGGAIAFRDPVAYRPPEPAAQALPQIPRPVPNRIDDPDLPPVGTIERKKELDRRNYHKRQAAKGGYVKKHDGTWGPRQRGLRSDNGQPHTPENRAVNLSTRARVLTEMEHRSEPTSSGELIRCWGIQSSKEKARVYNAMNQLASTGELQKVGVSASGHTYLRAGVANDHPQS